MFLNSCKKSDYIRVLDVLGLVAGAVLAMAGSATAQDAAKIAAGQAIWKDNGCTDCHGTFAEGGGGGERPAGPSLRSTRLNAEQMAETISCGRPGTPMAFHLEGAYTKVTCYGLPVGELPRGVTGGGELNAEQISDLVAYLTDRVVGKGPVTNAECSQFYGIPNFVLCNSYP